MELFHLLDADRDEKVELVATVSAAGRLVLDGTAVAVDTSGFGTPGSGTEAQAVLAELEARITALEP